MKKIKLIAALLSALFLTGCVDQSGNQSADNDTKEKRIVATSVATCEILDKLEVEGVVGVPKTDSYSIPKRYENAESVGSPMAPDMEIIKSLKPDIVLSPNSLEGELKSQYENIGVESYFLDLKSTEGMYESILALGKMLGKEEEAEKLHQESRILRTIRTKA